MPRLTRSSLLMVDGHFICLSEDGMVRLLKVNPQKYDVVSEWDVVDPETKEAAAEVALLGGADPVARPAVPARR